MDILQPILLFFIKYVLKLEGHERYHHGSDLCDRHHRPAFLGICLAQIEQAYGVCLRCGILGGAQILLITVGPLVPMPVLVVLCVMAGIGVSAAHVLPWAILPDAIEWDEYKTGKRHEGMFYSLVTLMGKIASSIAIPLTAVMLDVTGYIPNASSSRPALFWGSGCWLVRFRRSF